MYKRQGKNAKTKAGVQTYGLRQVPLVNGGLIAMDPHTGRILTLVGGYSFNQSQYNRATQANRQPGSAFKPFVYAAALENEFTPSSQVLDAPFVIERNDADKCDEEDLLLAEAGGDNRQTPIRGLRDEPIDDPENPSEQEKCERFYKPSNYTDGRWYGLSTLRLGLEKSRNAMTVRLASDIGMAPVMRIGERTGVYDKVQPELAWSLGAGETTLMRLAEGYSVLVNGGKEVTPRIIDRVQNGQGDTIYLQGEEACDVCKQDEWTGQSAPNLRDSREQVMDPITAYQVTYMLKGVVDNGTGRSISVLGRPLGGKTGTTNDYKDAWFMGFSPDLVTGVYVGYDTPRGLANEAGGTIAAPIFRDFMGEVLKDEPKVPFRIPEGITLAPVNRDTGEPSFIGAPNYILEAYRSGTEPRLGEFGSTISVGGGYALGGSYDDSSEGDVDFYDLDYGFEEEGSDEENPASDEEAVETSSDDVDTAEDANSSAADEDDSVASDTDAADAQAVEGDATPREGAADLDNILDDAKKAIDEKKTPKDLPKPPVEDEIEGEESLDDGIY